MKKRDLNEIANIEKAIAKRWGKDAVQNPKGNWDDEKEEKYLEQLKSLMKKEDARKQKSEKVKESGILIDKRLINNKDRREGPVCDIYSFDLKDDLYMNKYSCCYICFVEFVQDREERWKEGWRPDSDEIKQRRFKDKES